MRIEVAILVGMCGYLQNQVFSLQGVLKVMFTKYCTGAEEPRTRWGSFPALGRVLYHIEVRPLYAKGISKEKHTNKIIESESIQEHLKHLRASVSIWSHLGVSTGCWHPVEHVFSYSLFGPHQTNIHRGTKRVFLA